MAINALGEFVFVDFVNPSSRTGAPNIVRMMNETIQRPGINGTGIRRMGIKAEPFQMVSTVDLDTIAGAALLHKLYRGLCNSVAQPIIWRGVNYDSLDTRYQVLDVFDPDIRPLRNKVGGIRGAAASAAQLTITWRLQPVALAQLGGQLTN